MDLFAGDWQESSGERVVLHHKAGNEVCGGTLTRLESLLSALEVETNTKLAEPLHYYLVESSDEVDELCELRSEAVGKAIGCASPEHSRVVSTELAHSHELVHVLLNRELTPNHNLFVSEGLAEYFGSEVRPVGALTSSLEELYQSGVRLREAHQFVGYLIDAHGVQAVLAFYREIRSDTSYARFDELLRVRFGESAADIEDALVDHEAASGPFELCAGLSETIHLAPETVLTREPHCEDGWGRSSLSQSLDHVVLSSGANGLAFGGGGRVTACLTGASSTFSSDDPAGIMVLALTGATEYRLASWGTPTQIEVIELPVTEDCVPAYDGEVFSLEDGQELLSFMTSSPTALPFRVSSERTLEASLSSRFELCTADCDCILAGGSFIDAPPTVEPGEVYFLRTASSQLGLGTPGDESVFLRR